VERGLQELQQKRVSDPGATRMSVGMHELDRQKIFFEIVRLQDRGASVEDSRSRIVAEYGIDVDAVREIESEGLAQNWPPL
jgi:hypothetical protein